MSTRNETPFTLIADTREKNVTRHVAELPPNMITAQITIGDYAIADLEGRIVATIERKSYEDAAASLKDGRWANRSKLISLRQDTGCTIFFVIEGRPGISPDARVGGIPWRNIESSLFHMMVRDGFHVLYTKDTIETARLLTRLVASYGTLGSPTLPVIEAPAPPNNVAIKIGSAEPAPAANQPVTDSVVNSAPAVNGALAQLTKPIKLSRQDVVRRMWAKFRGITVVTADEFIAKWTLAQVFTEGPKDISTMKYATGRKVNAQVVKVLENAKADPVIQATILAEVPGISLATAKHLLTLLDIQTICGSNDLQNTICSGKRLGVRGEEIMALLHWRPQ